MSGACPDLDPEEWLLRRISPKQPLQPTAQGCFRPSSAHFAPSDNGGVSFNRERILRIGGEPLWYGCPDCDWGIAAIRIVQLTELGLEVRPTPPPPYHVDAFGLKSMGPGLEKRTRKRIAEHALLAIWPGRIETWPPTDIAPPGWRPGPS